MLIRYENTLEDMVAFNRYHIAHSPNARRATWALRFAVAFAALVPSVTDGLTKDDPGALPIGVVLAVVGVALAPRLVRWLSLCSVRRMYAAGANRGVVGAHELELVGDELIERNPVGESRMKLQTVERVASDGGYTFVYVGAVMAHVIPHATVSEGDPEAFAEALKHRLAAGSA